MIMNILQTMDMGMFFILLGQHIKIENGRRSYGHPVEK